MKREIQKSFKRLAKRLVGMRTESQALPTAVKTAIWSIGIYAGTSPFVFTPAVGITNPVLTADSVSDVPARFVADPFMIKADGGWHMFFEVLNSGSGRGEIGLATSRDGARWNYRQIVLREPFHLSYPYVFEWENQFYLVPESYQANSVRIYQATDFPVSWKFLDNLLTGDNFEDTSIFRHKDRWWLLTDHARLPYYAGTLRLFYSEHLIGPWIEHPKSPVVDANPHVARPAGRVLVWNDRVIRFTQDCCPVYGMQVRAFEITELSTTTYNEREIGEHPLLTGSGTGWNKDGMHHIDPHQINENRWIACVDGWHWDS